MVSRRSLYLLLICGGCLTVLLRNAAYTRVQAVSTAHVAPPLPRVWVYTLVASDYDGASLLPHFVEYYHSLGIRLRRFIVQVHHDPERHDGRGLALALGSCGAYGLSCTIWEGAFSSEDHLRRLLHLLRDSVPLPTDWVVLADSDEFQDWRAAAARLPPQLRPPAAALGHRAIVRVLAHAQAQGASYVRGTLVDRLAADGRLPPISPAVAGAYSQAAGPSEGKDEREESARSGAAGEEEGPLARSPDPPGPHLNATTSGTMHAQFPLQCRVVRNLYGGWDFKVAALRNFLRSGRANHKIVLPEHASAYFGPCPHLPSAAELEVAEGPRERRQGESRAEYLSRLRLPKKVKCPRARNVYREEDWFWLTPYSDFWQFYRHQLGSFRPRVFDPSLVDPSAPAAPDPGSLGGWQATPYARELDIHHFKWHAGVLDSMRDRAAHYAGNCSLDRPDLACSSLLPHWKESAKTYRALRDSRRLELAKMGCRDPAST